MRAVNNYIIIKGIKEDQKTDSGFIIQDNTEFRYLKGQVISVGERTEAITLDDIYVQPYTYPHDTPAASAAPPVGVRYYYFHW